MENILFSWSGGKDSALALYEIQKTKNYNVIALLTTITDVYDRISMHGVRSILLQRQADSLGYKLEMIQIKPGATNEEYERSLETVLQKYKNQGVSSVVFGDIFLEDLKRYREEKLSKIGMKGIFPLWGKDTNQLISRFIELGFKAVTTCVDLQVLDKKYAGQQIDKAFVDNLPPGIDVCGENGEFHSFVYAGPNFKYDIIFTTGEKVLRDERFYFCDLIP